MIGLRPGGRFANSSATILSYADLFHVKMHVATTGACSVSQRSWVLTIHSFSFFFLSSPGEVGARGLIHRSLLSEKKEYVVHCTCLYATASYIKIAGSKYSERCLKAYVYPGRKLRRK